MRQIDLIQTCFHFCSIWSKNKWSTNYFPYILIARNLQFNKNKLYKSLNYWSRYMLNFNFEEKDLGLVSSPHFVYDFSTKMFLKLYSLSNYIQFSLSDFIYFSIYCYNCLIEPFYFMTKKTRQKFKYLENQKSFWGEIKSIFIIFKEISIAKHFLRPESAHLTQAYNAIPAVEIIHTLVWIMVHLKMDAVNNLLGTTQESLK